MEILKEIILFMGLLCLIWLFVEGSAPIQFIKKILNLHPDKPNRNIYRAVLIKLISCSLCSGFWIGLIYYQDFLLAGFTSISAEIFHRLLNDLLNNRLNKL